MNVTNATLSAGLKKSKPNSKVGLVIPSLVVVKPEGRLRGRKAYKAALEQKMEERKMVMTEPLLTILWHAASLDIGPDETEYVDQPLQSLFKTNFRNGFPLTELMMKVAGKQLLWCSAGMGPWLFINSDSLPPNVELFSIAMRPVAVPGHGDMVFAFEKKDGVPNLTGTVIGPLTQVSPFTRLLFQKAPPKKPTQKPD